MLNFFLHSCTALRPLSRQRDSTSCPVIRKQDMHLMKGMKIEEEKEEEMNFEDREGEKENEVETGKGKRKGNGKGKEKEKEKDREKEKDKDKERPVQAPNNGTGRYFVAQAGDILFLLLFLFLF